jgi:transposase
MARKSSISDEQKAAIVAEVKAGSSVAEVAKKYKVSVPSVYIYVRGGRTSGKKKAAKKPVKRTFARQKVARHSRRAGAPTADADLSSMMEDISLARRFKALLDDLGYTKR